MLKTNTNIEEKIIFDEPMKKHTSFKIGGTADQFVKVTNEEELKEAIKYAKDKNLKITIIGNGSNLLVLDKGIRGLVIKIDIQKLEIERKEKYAEITVGSGYKTMALGIKLMNEELSGFEELSAMIGTYHYTSDYGTGRLMIEATEDGIDISDYESEDTYRFLANETNVKNEEENKVYLEYPAQVYEDDTVIFEYYILEKASDGIDVYYSPSSFDEAELLYHAVREN